mmetsp:Transcript_16705/g.46758  ORF Transcript_16705/g.46758 Transcript_16705/m.46758 type:complete len:301 (-) Transcript_16705:1101-2003(-)
MSWNETSCTLSWTKQYSLATVGRRRRRWWTLPPLSLDVDTLAAPDECARTGSMYPSSQHLMIIDTTSSPDRNPLMWNSARKNDECSEWMHNPFSTNFRCATENDAPRHAATGRSRRAVSLCCSLFAIRSMMLLLVKAEFLALISSTSHVHLSNVVHVSDGLPMPPWWALYTSSSSSTRDSISSLMNKALPPVLRWTSWARSWSSSDCTGSASRRERYSATCPSSKSWMASLTTRMDRSLLDSSNDTSIALRIWFSSSMLVRYNPMIVSAAFLVSESQDCIRPSDSLSAHCRLSITMTTGQ